MNGKKLKSETYIEDFDKIKCDFTTDSLSRKNELYQTVALIQLRESLDQTNDVLRDIYAAILEKKE